MAFEFRIRKCEADAGSGLFSAGIANITPETGQLARNQDRILAALDAFAGEGVNLALFPEYCLSGAFRPDRDGTAADMAGASLSALQPWLEDRVAPYISGPLKYVVVNAPEPDGRGGYYNTTLVVDGSGVSPDREKTYRKTFLPGAEQETMASGLNDSLVVDSPWGRMGFLTCYDICFPQPVTELVYTRSVDILVVPAAWRRQGKRSYPGTGIFETNFYQRQWEMLLPALATQYQVWVLAANGVGPHAIPGTDYCGGSGIWAPSGLSLMAGSDRQEELLVARGLDIRAGLDMERASFGCVPDHHRVARALAGTGAGKK